jgi:hypothetical protein
MILITTVKKVKGREERKRGRKEERKGNKTRQQGKKQKESTSSWILSLVQHFGQCYQQTELYKRYNGYFTSIIQQQIMM